MPAPPDLPACVESDRQQGADRKSSDQRHAIVVGSPERSNRGGYREEKHGGENEQTTRGTDENPGQALRHVAGKSLGADGLREREWAPPVMPGIRGMQQRRRRRSSRERDEPARRRHCGPGNERDREENGGRSRQNGETEEGGWRRVRRLSRSQQ